MPSGHLLGAMPVAERDVVDRISLGRRESQSNLPRWESQPVPLGGARSPGWCRGLGRPQAGEQEVWLRMQNRPSGGIAGFVA
jgi:hypothetical protein